MKTLRDASSIRAFIRENALSAEERTQKSFEKKLSSASSDEKVPERKASATVEAAAEEIASKKGKDVDVSDVIDQLNALRSGKSLKDPVVKKNFEEYFMSLKDSERVALLVFLKGIGQVLTGEVTGEEAIAPHESPANVEMMKTKKVTIKPNVIRKETPAKPEAEKAPETAPIKPKAK
jgi:hypothetical protein